MPSFIKSLLISAVAVSAAPSIFRRDAQTISQDLKWVNGNLTAVTDATNKWQGGLIKAIPLATAESHLEDSIKGASKGAEASDQISSDNTKQVRSIACLNVLSLANTGLDHRLHQQQADPEHRRRTHRALEQEAAVREGQARRCHFRRRRRAPEAHRRSRQDAHQQSLQRPKGRWQAGALQDRRRVWQGYFYLGPG